MNTKNRLRLTAIISIALASRHGFTLDAPGIVALILMASLYLIPIFIGVEAGYSLIAGKEKEQTEE